MAQITLNLDGEALREATVQAMLGVLTPETRAQIMESAIRALLTPSTSSWDRNKSPIELAFEHAVGQIAREEAHKLVAEDEALRTRMKELLRVTADRLLDVDVDKLTERMANSLAESMKGR